MDYWQNQSQCLPASNTPNSSFCKSNPGCNALLLPVCKAEQGRAPPFSPQVCFKKKKMCGAFVLSTLHPLGRGWKGSAPASVSRERAEALETLPAKPMGAQVIAYPPPACACPLAPPAPTPSRWLPGTGVGGQWGARHPAIWQPGGWLTHPRGALLGVWC